MCVHKYVYTNMCIQIRVYNYVSTNMCIQICDGLSGFGGSILWSKSDQKMIKKVGFFWVSSGLEIAGFLGTVSWNTKWARLSRPFWVPAFSDFLASKLVEEIRSRLRDGNPLVSGVSECVAMSDAWLRGNGWFYRASIAIRGGVSTLQTVSSKLAAKVCGG